jgi:pilus assembly protein CpaE
VVALVTQQTVAHLHDTKRLVFLLRDRLGIAIERILLLVNRFDKKAEVRFEDFVDVFPNVRIQTIPGDYLRASQSINLGIPICESAPRSPLGRSLTELAEGFDKPLAVSPPAAEKKPGMLSWLKRPARA